MHSCDVQCQKSRAQTPVVMGTAAAVASLLWPQALHASASRSLSILTTA